MVKRIALYGAGLAIGTFALAWLEYRRFAWDHGGELLMGLVALSFLALGVWVGVRLTGAGATPPPPGNPAAREALGISPRELDVLRELAAGRSNKEIALRLNVSPNTVKTHAARLYEKLGARRRTEAVAKARDLGLVG